MRTHWWIVAWLTCPALATAQPKIVTATSCQQPAVQAAVNQAADGDTVRIPAGRCVWPRQPWPTYFVLWSNKNLHVQGAGPDQTILDCEPCFFYSSSAPDSRYSHVQFSAFTLTAATVVGHGNGLITLRDDSAATVPNQGWIIGPQITFDYPVGSGSGIFIQGPTYGVVHHTTWTWSSGGAVFCASIHAREYPSSLTTPVGDFLASQPLDLGTDHAIFVEDNTFTIGGTLANVWDTSSGGCRVVFRHNTVVGAHLADHWTRYLEVGGITYEIYNNTFQGTANFNFVPMRLESGTGVIYQNQLVGYTNPIILDERRGFLETSGIFGACNGDPTHTWDGNAGDPAAPGWPCYGQIGRAPGKSMTQIRAGDKQTSAPLYLWANGPEPTCATGGACTVPATPVAIYDGSVKAHAYVRATPHPNGEVDYILGPRPGYVPYLYPHPLATAPTPPATDLVVTVTADPLPDPALRTLIVQVRVMSAGAVVAGASVAIVLLGDDQLWNSTRALLSPLLTDSGGRVEVRYRLDPRDSGTWLLTAIVRQGGRTGVGTATVRVQ